MDQIDKGMDTRYHSLMERSVSSYVMRQGSYPDQEDIQAAINGDFSQIGPAFQKPLRAAIKISETVLDNEKTAEEAINAMARMTKQPQARAALESAARSASMEADMDGKLVAAMTAIQGQEGVAQGTKNELALHAMNCILSRNGQDILVANDKKTLDEMINAGARTDVPSHTNMDPMLQGNDLAGAEAERIQKVVGAVQDTLDRAEAIEAAEMASKAADAERRAKPHGKPGQAPTNGYQDAGHGEDEAKAEDAVYDRIVAEEKERIAREKYEKEKQEQEKREKEEQEKEEQERKEEEEREKEAQKEQEQEQAAPQGTHRKKLEKSDLWGRISEIVTRYTIEQGHIPGRISNSGLQDVIDQAKAGIERYENAIDAANIQIEEESASPAFATSITNKDIALRDDMQEVMQTVDEVLSRSSYYGRKDKERIEAVLKKFFVYLSIIWTTA